MGHFNHKISEEPEFIEPKRSKKEEKRSRKHDYDDDDDEWGDDSEWSSDFDSLALNDEF